MSFPELFPTSVVGSLPRPEWLLEAIEKHERSKLDEDRLRSFYDDAVKLAIKEQESAGVDVVSDGEQRRFSFLAFVAEKLFSLEMKPVKDMMNEEAQKWVDKMNLPVDVIENPIIVGEIKREAPLAVDDLEFARGYTEKPIKVPLIGPYTLWINSWNKKLSSSFYPRPEDAVDDVAKLLREEIIALREAGASFVQLDEPGIGNFTDYRYARFQLAIHEWKVDDLKELHELAVDIINRAVRGIGGIRTGVHVCRGNWPAEEKYLSAGGYAPMLPDILDLRVDQLVLELATPRAGGVEVFQDHPTDHEIGLGVIDVKSPEVETPQKIVETVNKALRIFEADKIWLNPDCGFASGRPWPVATRKTAFAKLRAQSEASQMLREEFS
ncbi:MAG: vitamin-B12 independent methionine synthase [Candidatus Geothermarchaeales archaeon]